jgi:hypothetical protein
MPKGFKHEEFYPELKTVEITYKKSHPKSFYKRKNI